MFITLEGTPETGKNTKDGTISVTVFNGNGPFVYSWTSNVKGGGENIDNLPAGIYCVTVTDRDCCADEKCIEIKN